MGWRKRRETLSQGVHPPEGVGASRSAHLSFHMCASVWNGFTSASWVPGWAPGFSQRCERAVLSALTSVTGSVCVPAALSCLKLLSARPRGWQGLGQGEPGWPSLGAGVGGEGLTHVSAACGSHLTLTTSLRGEHCAHCPDGQSESARGLRQVLRASASPEPWTCAPPPAAPYLGRGGGQTSCFSSAPRPWPLAPGLEVVGTVGFRVRPSDTLSGSSGP